MLMDPKEEDIASLKWRETRMLSSMSIKRSKIDISKLEKTKSGREMSK